METELLLGLAAFALATSITPGPNNMMLMASGANFGLRRTLPHLLGVALGFVFMLVLVGAGIGELLQASPLLGEGLRWASLAFLCWLAWRLARSGDPAAASEGARPLTFGQAAAFQWVNPKAWAMALTAVGAYAPAADPVGLLLVALVFGLVNLPSTGLWAVLGLRVRELLTAPGRLRAFNVSMAALLMLSGVPLLVG